MLPRMSRALAPHEPFTADEAAGMFETFCRTDTLGDH